MMAAPLWKPQSSRIDRAQRRLLRRSLKAKEDRATERADRVKRDLIRCDVWTRDRGACRVCGCAVRLKSDNFLLRMESHHVKYRSQGGEDGLTNEIATCASCHNMEHRHLIDIDGDPNGVITIAIRHSESGTVIERRDSPCPQ